MNFKIPKPISDVYSNDYARQKDSRLNTKLTDLKPSLFTPKYLLLNLGVPLRQLRGLRRAIRGFASLRASHSLRLHYYPSRAPQLPDSINLKHYLENLHKTIRSKV